MAKPISYNQPTHGEVNHNIAVVILSGPFLKKGAMTSRNLSASQAASLALSARHGGQLDAVPKGC